MPSARAAIRKKTSISCDKPGRAARSADLPRGQEAQRIFFFQGIIDACRPFPWRNEFPEVCESSPALKEQVLSKWRQSVEHNK